MSVKQLDAKALRDWVDGLRKSQTVIGPVEKKGRFAFETISKSDELRLDYDTTQLPPKKFLQPAKEVLVTFKKGEYKSVFEQAPFVLLGVHPYDVVAISQMDRLFTEGQYDSHYAARRAQCTLVALDVETIGKNHFAGAMGTAVTDKGWDVLLTKVGNGYLVEAKTDKGRAIAKALDKAPDATADQLKDREKVWARNRREMREGSLKTPLKDLPELLKKSYKHPLWEENAKVCLSCGSCNIVCPTCYCFDVQDDVDWSLDCGTRCRSWDGCLLNDFAVVAGNHNFRKKTAERYRHRFYRKGKYIPEKIGEVSCVGCGRCGMVCIPKIADPLTVYNKLGGN